MTERKFTDEEIIKALKHCGSNYDGAIERRCEDCPLDSICDFSNYDTILIDYAIDLINRQKEKLEICENALERITKGLPKVKALHNREIQQAKAEALTEYVTELERRLIAGGLGIAFVRSQMYKLLKEKTEDENES